MARRKMDMFAAAMIADGEWELAGFTATEENLSRAYQFLINTGAAWHLQGRIGRTAMDMIQSGLCTRPAAVRVGAHT